MSEKYKIIDIPDNRNIFLVLMLQINILCIIITVKVIKRKSDKM